MPVTLIPMNLLIIVGYYVLIINSVPKNRNIDQEKIKKINFLATNIYAYKKKRGRDREKNIN